jgi:hypothetical protein
MRAKEFIIKEAAPFKPDLSAELQKDWMPSKFDIHSPELKAKNISLPKDELGRPIEPGLEQPLVSPEDIIGLGAPSMAKGIAKVAQGGTKLVQKAEPHLLGLDPTRPIVQNKLYSPKIGGSGFPAGSTQSAYNVRGVRRPEEIEDLLSTGFMTPRPGAKPGSAKSTSKYFTQTDDPKDIEGYYSTLRVPSNKTPSGRAVRSKDVEVFDRQAGAWRTISPDDAPSAKQAAQWEKTKKNIPGMSPVVKQEPTNARDAAIQQWMKEKGRLPTERYPGNWSGLNQQETQQLSKLIQDYEQTNPRYGDYLPGRKIP